jgi:hypothetical protein
MPAMEKKPRAVLDSELDALELRLATFISELDESEVFDAFAGEAEVIEEAAGPEDAEHVRSRLDCMLASQGLIPGDNEGEPCA